MTRFILLLNRIFRPPRVKGRESRTAYADWEYEMGQVIVRQYLEPASDLHGKRVLDVGCGLGGKTLAYEEAGASVVMGTDIVPQSVIDSAGYVGARSTAGNAVFCASDAAALPVPDASFDTVVANDAMEHFGNPEAALAEMARVTRGGGIIWIFFTPHYSPLGSHLYDYIYTPWCHLLFTPRQIEKAIREVLKRREPDVPDAERETRLKEIMRSYDEDINHMSVRWFQRIIRLTPSLKITRLDFWPARYRFFRILLRIPIVREPFTRFVVCRLQKED